MNQSNDAFVNLLLKTGLVKSEGVAKAILVVDSLILIALSCYLIL